MFLRFTVFGVAEETQSNAFIGLVAGNLQWASAEISGSYTVGIIDQNSFSGITRSISNVVNGGTFSTGFTGTLEVTAKNETLAGLVFSKALTLNGKIARLEASLDGYEWVGIYNFPISSVNVVDELTISMRIQTATLANKIKLSSVSVTPEMALNNADSKAIGKPVQNAFGNKVFYPMIYCEPRQVELATMVTDHGRIAGPTSNILFNGDAEDILHTGSDSELYQMMTNDLSFMKGSSVLQCCGVWQSADDGPVWLAFSFNGKQLLANSNINPTYFEMVKQSLVGRRLKIVHGEGRGDFYSITDIEWTAHTVEFNSTSIETLWFQVNTTKPDQFNYTLPNYSSSTIQEGSSPLAFFRKNTFQTKIKYFVGCIADGFTRDFNVTQATLQLDSGCYIVHSDADVSACEVYAKLDDRLEQATSVESIESVYKGEGWQLIKIPTVDILDVEESKIEETTSAQITTKLYEQYVSGDPDPDVLNGVISISGLGSQVIQTDNVPAAVISVSSAGYGITGNGFDIMNEAVSYNTLYCKVDASMFEKDSSICIIPEFRKYLQNLAGGGTGQYTAEIEIQVFAINEGNIAIGRKISRLKASFNKLDPYTTAGNVWVKPSEKTVSFGPDCTSHPTNSNSAYKSLVEGLTFDSGELYENNKFIRGFVVCVAVTYKGLWAGLIDSRNLTKVLYPSSVVISKTLEKENLYLSCVKDSAVSTPVGIAKSVLESFGMTCEPVSFANAISQQRAFFTTLAGDFDGQIIPEQDDSILDVVDKICKSSLTAIRMNADGSLSAKFLGVDPEAAVYSFDGEDIKKETLSIAQSDTGNSYNDFDFSIVKNIVEDPLSVSVNLQAESFPLESEIALGTLNISTAGGYSFVYLTGSADNFDSIAVRGPSRNVIGLLLPGTNWRLFDGTNEIVFRIDTIAPDLTCPIGSFGVRIGAKALSRVGLLSFTGSLSLRLWGPNATWKEYVSGFVEDYGTAKEIWEACKNAKARIGTEVKAPKTITESKDPIWGSDSSAIASWAKATVLHCTKEKFVIRFQSDATQALLNVNELDYVSFAWGVFASSPVNGYVVEKSLDTANGVLGFTLVCFGELGSIPLLLAEDGVSFSTETGFEFALEDPASMSKKISELVEAPPEVLAAAGAYLVTSTGGATNNKTLLSAINTWITTPLQNAITTISNALSNKIDKVTGIVTGQSIRLNSSGVFEPYTPLELGETSSTAYRGDRGKTAYDHSQLITGNPHNVTVPQISGLQGQLDGKAALNTTLVDSAASTTLPYTASDTLVSKIQALRNNVKYILANLLALGETTTTAYRGDRGKTAYDHSQAMGNPHGTDFSELENKPTTLAGYGITDATVKRSVTVSTSAGWYRLGYVDLKVNTYNYVFGEVYYSSASFTGLFSFSAERKTTPNTLSISTFYSISCQNPPSVQWEVLGNGDIRVSWYAYFNTYHHAFAMYNIGSAAPLTNAYTHEYIGATKPANTELVNYLDRVTLTDEPAQDVPPSGNMTQPTAIQWLRNNVKQLQSTAAQNGTITTQDWDSFTSAGVFTVADWSGANGPVINGVPVYPFGQLVVEQYGNTVTQIYYSSQNMPCYRHKWGVGWGGSVWKTSPTDRVTLTDEPAQDVLPSGSMTQPTAIQWLRNNVNRIFTVLTNKLDRVIDAGRLLISYAGGVRVTVGLSNFDFNNNGLQGVTPAPESNSDYYATTSWVRQKLVPSSVGSKITSSSTTITPVDGQVRSVANGVTVTLNNTAKGTISYLAIQVESAPSSFKINHDSIEIGLIDRPSTMRYVVRGLATDVGCGYIKIVRLISSGSGWMIEE